MKFKIDVTGQLPKSCLGLVVGETLLVPKKVANVATSHGLGTAEELVSWMMTFPQEAAELFGSTIDDVNAAVTDLQRALNLGGPRPIPKPFGVLPPPGIEFGKTTAADLAALRRKRQ